MSKLVVALAITSVTFAATTAYFARELSLERDRNAAAPTATAATPRAAAEPARANSAAPRLATFSAAVAAQASSRRDSPGAAPGGASEHIRAQALDWRQAMAPKAPGMLAMIADPAKRAQLVKDQRDSLRSIYEPASAYAGLSAEETEQFLDAMAEDTLRAMEANYRCALDDGCDVATLGRRIQATTPAVEAAIGADRKAKIDLYMESGQEREMVARLRGRLPDDAPLPQAQADRLVGELIAEKKNLNAEANARGAGVSSFSNGDGMIYTTTASASAEERLAEAAENGRRLRQRAAQILTPEQLKYFDQQQDAVLASMREIARMEQMQAQTQPN